jgi:hypothetical protein
MMSNETDIKYYDSNGFMAPHGENGVLFTAEYARLRQMTGKPPLFPNGDVRLPIEVTLSPGRDPLSHDNMTAIVCLSKQFNLGYEKNLFHREWWRRLHPRDIIFYLYMKGGILGALAKPFLFITILSGLYACYHKQETGKTLDTDGKLLHWLRVETCDWKLTRKISSFILEDRHNMTWDDIFKIYFKEWDNPIRVIAGEYYAKIR